MPLGVEVLIDQETIRRMVLSSLDYNTHLHYRVMPLGVEVLIDQEKLHKLTTSNSIFHMIYFL